MTDLPARVLFGAAYYHEYHPAYGPDARPDEQLKTDLDLMAEACQVVGGRESARPGADHQHPLAAAHRRPVEPPPPLER